MRILHSADWHIGELPGQIIEGKNARLQDTLICIDFLVKYAQTKHPDVTLISGDLFDKSKLWGDNMLYLIDEAAKRLRLLSKIAPVVLLFGTDNHDNLRAFENIKNMRIPNLFVETSPNIFKLMTPSGQLQVACIPGFDKGYFRAKNPGMAPAEESAMCSQLLGDMVNGLSAQLDPTIPSVLMAHYTVVGCELDNGQHVFTQSEVVLPKESLAGSAFDLVALGHIHRAQQVECAGKPIFYSGPVNGITFNEEGQDKGFWMHEIQTESGVVNEVEFDLHHQVVSSEFINTPSREFLTLKLNEQNIETIIDYLGENPTWLFGTQVKNKIIRVHYSCTDELDKQLNRKALEKDLYTAGAFHIAEIKPEKITTALVKQELTETAGPLENLATWLTTEGFSPEEIPPILELSRPLIATISAKMPTGTLSGIFEPRSLEVKNYRSYLQETFNFQDIFFATVNGPNGIGKSAFFMDSILDCLYEETRTGVTGSWITNGQTEGMLNFEFSMGATNWRIIRTRSIKGSGKITLALQEYLGDKWEDRSGTTTKQTQEKIESLLGMDCATFRCTALIMQDAYGLFMEADKEQRMGVLANILGLSIYDQLTDLAKNKVTELNKHLTISKSKLTDLNEKLKAKPGLVSELTSYESDLKQVALDITAKELEIKVAEELVRSLKSKAEKVEEMEKQIKVLSGEISIKQSEIKEKQTQATRAQQILDNEEQILAKSVEYEQVKERITVLKTKEPRLAEIAKEHKRLLQEDGQIEKQIEQLKFQAGGIKNYLAANRSDLEKLANEYQDAIVSLEAMDKLSIINQELLTQITEIEQDTNRTGSLISVRNQQLEDLQSKAAMLGNSNCIDPKNAKCAFLTDAQQASLQMPLVEAEIKKLSAELEPRAKKAGDLRRQQFDLGYSIMAHQNLKDLVATLRVPAQEYTQIASKEELLRTLQDQLTPLQERREQALPRLFELDSEGTDLQAELGVLPGLNERLLKLLAWSKAKEELPAARQLVASVTDIIKGIETDIDVKQGQIRTLEDEKLLNNIEASGLREALTNADKLCGNLKYLQDLQNEFFGKVGALKAQLEALAKDDEERRKLIADMEPVAKDLVHYQNLAKAFGPDGIPFGIVRSVIPELSATSNEILGQMTGGKMALEMRTERVQKSNKKEVNALEVWITDWRGNIPYKDRSGGQKVKAALANAFALADLKARRVGIQLGMMFVDEPPFLDSEGVEAYCDALEQLNYRYPNMRVIAISHDPAMKARFPQQIDVVDMGDEGSKVRIA